MKLVGDIKGHSEGVNHVLVLRDSRQLLTASSDKTIQLWNGESGELLQTFKGHEARVNCVSLILMLRFDNLTLLHRFTVAHLTKI